MNEVKHKAIELYRNLAELLIEHPKDLVVDAAETSKAVTLIVSPNTNDQGRLIGEKGVTVKALKYLHQQLCAMCGKAGHLIQQDSEGDKKPRVYERFAAHDGWDPNAFRIVLLSSCRRLFPECEVSSRELGTVTIYVIHVQGAPSDRSEHIRSAFDTIFHAAGKRVGRIVMMEMEYANDTRHTERAAVP